ncbi:MAG: hypothetical protein M3R63_17375 [Actinomycetota bacterium]|nr:hypothetical protein [Actinomycetota bacterium]
MTRETNIATQENAARHINAGEIDVGVDTLFAVDAVDHDPAPGQGAGREGFRGLPRRAARPPACRRPRGAPRG